jgi:hypothetical protein
LPAARRGVLLVEIDDIMVKLPSFLHTEREHTEDGRRISRRTSPSPTPRVARGKERNRGRHPQGGASQDISPRASVEVIAEQPAAALSDSTLPANFVAGMEEEGEEGEGRKRRKRRR